LLVNIADGLGDEQRIVAHGAPPASTGSSGYCGRTVRPG
jgi:hypothetical protein